MSWSEGWFYSIGFGALSRWTYHFWNVSPQGNYFCSLSLRLYHFLFVLRLWSYTFKIPHLGEPRDGEAASMPNWPQLGRLWLTVPAPVRGHRDHPPPSLQTYTGAPSRAFHDEGPSLLATRGNLTIVVGIDKQKTNSYRGIVHILRQWWKMYYSEIV